MISIQTELVVEKETVFLVKTKRLVPRGNALFF